MRIDDRLLYKSTAAAAAKAGAAVFYLSAGRLGADQGSDRKPSVRPSLARRGEQRNELPTHESNRAANDIDHAEQERGAADDQNHYNYE